MNTKYKKVFSVLLVVVLLMTTLSITGCTEDGDENQLVIGQTHEPESMNPISYTDVYSGYIFLQIFQPLVRNNPNGETNTGGNTVATDYEISDDALEYTFHIEEGLKFHNGDDLTADDVVFTINTIMNETDLENAPISPRKADLDSVDRVEAEDDYTVKMYMKERDVMVLKKEAFEMNIVPKDYIVENGWDKFEDELIGSGPYEFDEYKTGVHIKLKEFEDYNGEVNIEKVRFDFYGDENSAMIDLREGSIHYMPRISPTNWHQLRDEDGDARVESYPEMGSNFIRFKQDDPDLPWTDARVRKAFAYAIDADEVIKAVRTEELSDNTRSPIPSTHVAHADVMKYEQDIDKAKDLLEEAGYSDGIESELYVPNDERSDEMEVVQEQVKEAGFDLELVSLEWNEFIGSVQSGEAPVSYSGWSGSASAYSLLNLYMSNSEWNWYAGWYNSTDYNEKVNEAGRTVEDQARNELYKDAQRILVDDDMGIYTVYVTRATRAYHDSLDIPEEQWNPFGGAGPLTGVNEWTLE
ncbi:MAG: ABC transporter substrate-binding protein [Thermoplasmata archaeon]